MIIQPARGFISGGASAPIMTFGGTTTAVGTGMGIPTPISIPPVSPGDLIVLVTSGDDIAVLPSGFSQGFFSQASGRQVHVMFKRATGAETTINVIDSGSGDDGLYEVRALVFKLSAASYSRPLFSNGTFTNSNPAAVTLSTNAYPTPTLVLAFYGVASPGAVDPRSMTPAKSGEYAMPSPSGYLAFRINNSPEDVVIDMDDEGSQNILSHCAIVSAF